ncbi:MAG: tyrosine-type recombinase/integrase [Rhodospirillales bacterium]|nr:tyrosine-type recombinase/integrase [Rhodospirillales bacterium]
MTRSSSKSTNAVGSLFVHSGEAEYVAYLSKLPMDESFRRKRLEYRANFISQWPDPKAWFSEPLPVRIGCLAGDRQAFPTYPVSFRARTYLYYLALTDRIRLDYDFLFAVGNMRVAETLAPLDAYFGLDQLVADSSKIGYSETGMRSSLYGILPRFAMHSGIRSFDDLRQCHLDELTVAVKTFAARKDAHLFKLPDEDFPKGFQRGWHHRIRRLQLLLFHRGNDVIRPRIIPDKRKPMPSPRPDLQEWADRWINRKRQTLARPTVDHLAVSLRQFVAFLSAASPAISTFADVTPEYFNAYLLFLQSETAQRTGAHLSITARRARAGAVARFLADGAAWGWPNFPNRPLLDPNDLPRLAHRVPRFIPAAELSRLMEQLPNLTCEFQRTALLVARWSGARRSEITRLRLDCLDRYPDGTARLRIPAGKTMRERMVPLHDDAAASLRALIAKRLQARDRPILDERTGEPVRFVFYRRSGRISPDYLFQHSLKTVCMLAGLVNPDGKPIITAHRFRHTVGTQLAERGAKLHTIMSVLGHQSPHMSMVYARISDAEVLKDYQSVLGPGASLAGPGAEAIRAGRLSNTAVYWLKSNFIKTELELGHCLRLPSEGPCECDLYLSCTKFVTTPAYAGRLRERHRLELNLAEDAKQRAWPREVERHCTIARRIEQLLNELGEPLKNKIKKTKTVVVR